jgi:hypothetical protein
MLYIEKKEKFMCIAEDQLKGDETGLRTVVYYRILTSDRDTSELVSSPESIVLADVRPSATALRESFT